MRGPLRLAFDDAKTGGNMTSGSVGGWPRCIDSDAGSVQLVVTMMR